MEQNMKDLEGRLYDKSYTCPVCGKNFKSREIRKGKIIFVEIDLGLRSKFKPIMPDYYYTVICDGCGYAAVTKTFNRTNGKHIKNIKEKLNKNYTPKKYPLVYSPEVVIDRYKIALYFAYIKDSDISERAYIAQKIASIYSDIQNEKLELEYNEHAYNWYQQAFLEERFPIMGMEENQFIYTLSYLAYKTGHKAEAKKTLSKIITKRDLSPTLKEKINDFITLLKEEDKA